MTTGTAGAPRNCEAPVELVGVLLVQRTPVEAWLGFCCRQHQAQVVGARPLEQRHRDTFDDWVRRRHDATHGKPWRPPEPLAVGAAARELVARAEVATRP